jgi:hypothetical protein
MLMPSVRRTAEAYSEKERVSLNQFINVAVAEKVAHLEHEEWLRRRKQPDKASIAKALRTLDSGGKKVQKEDALAEGYVSVRDR